MISKFARFSKNMAKIATLRAMDVQTGWAYRNETLHCDGMPLERLREDLRQEFGHGASPAFVYSYSTLVANARSYTSALATLGSRGILSYSLKANSNPALLKVLRDAAGVCMATCVSGNEIQMALRVGFPADLILLNGNGKRWWEVELAVRSGCLLNVDSLFDAHRIISVARTVGKKARVLLRLNPDMDAETHPYLATAHAHSKFGVVESQIQQVLLVLYEARDNVMLEGVHAHVGSGITRIDIYIKLMTATLSTLEQIRKSGWSAASTVNLGGGLNVSFTPPSNSSDTNPSTVIKSNASTSEKLQTDSGNSAAPLMTPGKLVEMLLPLIPDDVTLILEPGRSIVATAGVLLTEVIGVKSSKEKQFVVVDAAMTEVIRPALYGAHHALTPLTTQAFCTEGEINSVAEESAEGVEVEVVGPVCESSDVLARGCVLPRLPSPGAALVIWTAGAYCFSMASHYNLRPHAIEVLVHGTGRYTVIRRPQQFLEVIGNCEQCD